MENGKLTGAYITKIIEKLEDKNNLICFSDQLNIS